MKIPWLVIALIWVLAFGSYYAGVCAGRMRKENTPTCTRCKSMFGDTSEVSYEGRDTIRLCRKCQYDQAAAFIKFCPVEEE